MKLKLSRSAGQGVTMGSTMMMMVLTKMILTKVFMRMMVVLKKIIKVFMGINNWSLVNMINHIYYLKHIFLVKVNIDQCNSMLFQPGNSLMWFMCLCLVCSDLLFQDLILKCVKWIHMFVCYGLSSWIYLVWFDLSRSLSCISALDDWSFIIFFFLQEWFRN